MTEDEMYDIIRGYEESELDYHERNIELENENSKLREQASEGERVGRMLLEYRDDPPVKTAGSIEGAWYESGDILAIIMEKDEFTTGELLTRLAYLMGAREER